MIRLGETKIVCRNLVAKQWFRDLFADRVMKCFIYREREREGEGGR
jgi:hypothetical protein